MEGEKRKEMKRESFNNTRNQISFLFSSSFLHYALNHDTFGWLSSFS